MGTVSRKEVQGVKDKFKRVCANVCVHKLTVTHTHTHHGCMLMGMTHKENMMIQEREVQGQQFRKIRGWDPDHK